MPLKVCQAKQRKNLLVVRPCRNSNLSWLRRVCPRPPRTWKWKTSCACLAWVVKPWPHQKLAHLLVAQPEALLVAQRAGLPLPALPPPQPLAAHLLALLVKLAHQTRCVLSATRTSLVPIVSRRSMATRLRTSRRCNARTSSPHRKARSLAHSKNTSKSIRIKPKSLSATLAASLAQRKCPSVYHASTTASALKPSRRTIRKSSSTGSAVKAGWKAPSNPRRKRLPQARPQLLALAQASLR